MGTEGRATESVRSCKSKKTYHFTCRCLHPRFLSDKTHQGSSHKQAHLLIFRTLPRSPRSRLDFDLGQRAHASRCRRQSKDKGTEQTSKVHPRLYTTTQPHLEHLQRNQGTVCETEGGSRAERIRYGQNYRGGY